MTFKCFLCVTMNWDKETMVPVFAGYHMYSSEPWNLTNTGQLNAAIYITESEESYQEAQKRMEDAVQHLAKLMPGNFWKTVWKWVDPSPEAHEERFNLLMGLQPKKTSVLRVATFTTTPGARYRTDGRFSGEEFRDDHLIPAFRAALGRGEVLIVDLDGVEGYAASFLEEVFGGMVRSLNIPPPRLSTVMRFVCNDEPELIEEIQHYIHG